MNCPNCNSRLRRQFTPEGVEIFWCEKCKIYVEYEEEENTSKKDENNKKGGNDGLNSK